jgi:hypothetical protein
MVFAAENKRNILPQHNVNSVRCFLLLLLAGLLVRLLIMPFFCHVDFLSEMRRVHETILAGYYYPGKARLVVYFVEMAFMQLFLPFLPDAQTMFFVADGASSTAGLTSYSLFVSSPCIFRTLFLLKIPYLLFDMGTAIVLFIMFKEKKQQLAAVACWLFNPVTLYTFYIFGRYESIAIFFMAMSILMVSRNRLILAAIMLGVAVNSREMYIFFIPLFLLVQISKSISWIENCKRICVSLAILVVMFVLPVFIQKFFSLHPFINSGGSVVAHEISRFWGLHLHWVSPFFALYAIICLWLIETRNPSEHFKYVAATAMTIGSFFICCTHSAHYSSWFVLYPICMLFFNRKTVFALGLFSLCWFVFWLFNTDAGVFTLFLASPLHKNLFGLKSIPQLYEYQSSLRGWPDLQFIKWFFHTMYAVSIGYLMVKMIKEPARVR